MSKRFALAALAAIIMGAGLGPSALRANPAAYTAEELADAKTFVEKLSPALREKLEKLAKDTGTTVEAVFLDALASASEDTLGKNSAKPNVVVPKSGEGAKEPSDTPNVPK